LEKLKFKKFYIDRKNTQYVIVQEQRNLSNFSNSKSIIIRSPVSINNTLKIPIEIRLRRKNGNNGAMMNQEREEAKFNRDKSSFVFDSDYFSFNLTPNEHQVIPLHSIFIEEVQIRAQGFDWSNPAKIDHTKFEFQSECLFLEP
jgi:hypothetical protein